MAQHSGVFFFPSQNALRWLRPYLAEKMASSRKKDWEALSLDKEYKGWIAPFILPLQSMARFLGGWFAMKSGVNIITWRRYRGNLNITISPLSLHPESHQTSNVFLTSLHRYTASHDILLVSLMEWPVNWLARVYYLVLNNLSVYKVAVLYAHFRRSVSQYKYSVYVYYSLRTETFSSTLTSEEENAGMGGIAMLTLSDTENNLHFILILQGLIKNKDKGRGSGLTWKYRME